MSDPAGAQPIPEEDDESLKKWKASLLGDADNEAASPKDDPRKVIPLEFKIIIEGGETLTFDISTPEKRNEIANTCYDLKEGQTFHYELSIHVHHDIVLGLRFVTKSRKAIKSFEEQFDVGSYPPTVAPIVKVMEDCEAPAGAMVRGSYKAQCKLVDEAGNEHFSFDMKFNIVKA